MIGLVDRTKGCNGDDDCGSSELASHNWSNHQSNSEVHGGGQLFMKTAASQDNQINLSIYRSIDLSIYQRHIAPFESPFRFTPWKKG
jgi:hypothetical protein